MSKLVPKVGKAPARVRDLWSLGVLPVLAAGALAGLLGIYWDIAWHIDIGRDTFFTPPHNFLYASMATVLVMSLYGLWRDRRETYQLTSSRSATPPLRSSRHSPSPASPA